MSKAPAKIAKTNAARLLDRLHLPYELLSVPVDESDLSAVTVAARLGADPACVFKTLVARGDRCGILMACIPAAAELDLKALAAASGNKHVEMVHLKEVFPLTGYIRGGCSPLAAKKPYPVFVDDSAEGRDVIFVSAGQRGVQLRLAPEVLRQAAQARLAPICRMPSGNG